MALHLISTVFDEQLKVYFDVNNQDRVIGVQTENNSPWSCRIDVTRPSGQEYSEVVTTGTVYFTLPNNRRFRYSDEATSDWSVSITPLRS